MTNPVTESPITGSMRSALFLLVAGFLLSACGQKGPLYLPRDQSDAQQTEQPQTQSRKQPAEEGATD